MSAQISRILVALDGSETSDYALNLAIKIGERESSVVDLFHVIAEPISSSTSGPVVFDPALGPAAVIATPQEGEKAVAPSKGANRDRMLEDRCVLVQAQHLECSGITVYSNDVAGEILKAASGKQYDLIVLGSRGLGGIKGFFLGSVSQKVARDAKTSVLIVKTRIEGIPKILLGYDGSDEGKKALELASSLAKEFNALVTAVTVISIPISPEGYISASSMEKWEKEARNQVDEAVSVLKGREIKAEGKLLDAVDIARGLSDEAEKGLCDLMIVGNRGRGRLESLLLGSVASGVANTAKTNVLIVR